MRAKRVLALLAVLVLASCAASPSIAPPTGTPSPAAPTSAPTPTPVAYADTLRIGLDLGWNRGWLEGVDMIGVPALTFGRLVYSGLYRYDARDDAVPDLADGKCFTPGADGKVIRCRLVETTFQDGTPLTADDVVYTYQIFQRPVMNNCCALMPTLKEARVVDPRTVDFVLSAVDPTFLTGVLPMIPILSRHSVEAALAAYDAASKGLTAKSLAKLADDIKAEISSDPKVCTDARVAEVDALLSRFGWHVYHEDLLTKNGEFDACGWLGNATVNLSSATDYGGSAGYALGQTGIDRVAGVVGLLLFTRPDIFVGTGPYRYVSQDVNAVHFEAWPGYHGGMAATRYVDFVRAKGDGSDAQAAKVDILPGAYLGSAFQATAAAHGLKVVTLPTGGYYVLTFNVRPERLFADVALRRALQLCIDLPSDVDAATGGGGTPIAGPVMPGSWGYDTDLRIPARDTAKARGLIEAAGWSLGSDGVYEKAGARLAAQILVRASDDVRVRMAGLIASQARDCGMALTTTPLGDDAYWPVFSYPHLIPGAKQPFDLMLGMWLGGPDPDMTSIYSSSAITSAKQPDSNNCGGFSDPAFDSLVTAGEAVYDQAERTRIYRAAQQELAAQLPAIFLWAANSYDVLRSAVTTSAGPLDLTAPNWAWQPERLVVVKEGTP